MSRLPTVTYNGDAFFIDRRLNQLRNTANPHLYYDFDSDVDLEYFVFRLQREEEARVRRQERRRYVTRMIVWALLYVALLVGAAYAVKVACAALGVD
jgi:hypothetical protein